jgi:hypothetical protein
VQTKIQNPVLFRTDCPAVVRVAALPSSLHAAPTVPTGTYEALSRLVSPSAASQWLVAGQHRLVVPPTRRPRPPPRGRIFANDLRTYIIITYATYLYNLVESYGFYIWLHILIENINNEGVSSKIGRTPCFSLL